MVEYAAEFEKLKKELRDKLASIKSDFPNATAEYKTCKDRVDEFCRYARPANDQALLTLTQARTMVKMDLDFTWNSLNLNKIADSNLPRH